MQFFDYEECEQIKETNLYQNRLKEIKAWLKSDNNKPSTVAVLLDSNIYDPLSIIEKWGFQITSLQVNMLPIIHPEQPIPLKWLVLDTSLSINEQMLELLLLISIYETQQWRSGNDRYGVSVCLWSKNANTVNKDAVYSYTNLGRIYISKNDNKGHKKHYLRYWDSRVFIHLEEILNSDQYLLYRHYLSSCLYIQPSLKWQITQDKEKKYTEHEQAVIDRFNKKIVSSTIQINSIQKKLLNKVALINQCIVLAYKSKDDLVNPKLLNSDKILKSIKKYIESALSSSVKEEKQQYIWVLLSLTVHPTFYLHPRVQIAMKDKKASFTKQMQTISNEGWQIIKQASY